MNPSYYVIGEDKPCEYAHTHEDDNRFKPYKYSHTNNAVKKLLWVAELWPLEYMQWCGWRHIEWIGWGRLPDLMYAR
jgi:hypothetical protein